MNSSDNENKIILSVVVPAYNESESFSILLERLQKVCIQIDKNYEVIVIDDGSTDNSREVLECLLEKYQQHLKCIFFSRNFGHQAALNAGLDYARGEGVVVMDADMQQPPELIAKMYESFKDGNDIIMAVREENEQNSALRSSVGNFFYYLINKISNLNLQSNVADFGLYSRAILNVLKQLPEKDRFLRGLVQWVGFKRSFVQYKASKRMYGASKYNYKKLLKLALTGVISFSAFPLRLSLWVGGFMAVASFIYGIYILVAALFFEYQLPPGWASLILIVLFIGGLQLIIMGIIGEYLYRIFNETKKRPLYIIDKTIGLEDKKVKSLYGINSKM